MERRTRKEGKVETHGYRFVFKMVNTYRRMLWKLKTMASRREAGLHLPITSMASLHLSGKQPSHNADNGSLSSSNSKNKASVSSFPENNNSKPKRTGFSLPLAISNNLPSVLPKKPEETRQVNTLDQKNSSGVEWMSEHSTANAGAASAIAASSGTCSNA